MERKHGCAGCLTVLAVVAVIGLISRSPDKGKRRDEGQESQAKEAQVADARPAPKTIDEAPPAAPGLDPVEVTRLTADRQRALKLYNSLHKILGLGAMSFADARHGYCEVYVETVLGMHSADEKDVEEARKSMLDTTPLTDEQQIARDRNLEEVGNKFIAYQQRAAMCEASIEAGTLQMPSKVDMETQAYQAKQEIAAIDRKLTNPTNASEPNAQTLPLQAVERPADASQSSQEDRELAAWKRDCSLWQDEAIKTLFKQEKLPAFMTPDKIRRRQEESRCGIFASMVYRPDGSIHSVEQWRPQEQAPAPPAEASKPISGVLCNWPVEVPQNGEVKFRNLPNDRLKFTFDHDAWLPRIQREPDGTQTLIMRSIKPGVQTMCDIRWEVVQ